jgi:uncharacterized membrane protein
VTNQTHVLGRWLPAAILVGTLAAAGLMLAGLLLGVAAIAWYGLLLLVLTPVLQLGVSVVGFGRLGEPRYSLIAAIVLILLLAALAAAALLARGQGG